jgi:hypothetical protein
LRLVGGGGRGGSISVLRCCYFSAVWLFGGLLSLAGVESLLVSLCLCL